MPWIIGVLGNTVTSLLVTLVILLITILIGWQLVLLIEWIMSRKA